jgi:membrane-associated phospholipid phosphatase
MKRMGLHVPVGTIVLSAVLFGWLAHTVAGGPAGRFDLAVRGLVHAWASPPFTLAMRGITLLGSTIFLVILGGGLAWRWIARGRGDAAVLLAAAALGGELLDQSLKLLYARPRPEPFFGLEQPETYSFPSGHSMTSACFFAAVAMIAAEQARSRGRRCAIWAGAAAVIGLIGFSRIYLGVHYPTDVLGGYLGAVAWLALIRAVMGRNRGRSTSPPEPPASPPRATPEAS